MIDSIDPQTVISCRLLRRAVEDHQKPVVLWIGAGASAWNGFPIWIDLARLMRREFFRSHADFDNDKALDLIKNDLPALFGLCKDLDSARYFRFLTNSLGPRPTSVLYRRLVEQIKNLQPAHILTTNVDEALEQSLGPIRVVQKTDLSMCAELLHSGTPFVAKLHGTVSSVESLVFATDDYKSIKADQRYVPALKSVFSNSTVVFLGYGLRDEYVVGLLRESAREQELFGAGPHFIVTPDTSLNIPTVHRICYRNIRFKDHRAAMTVLSVIHQSIDATTIQNVMTQPEVNNEHVERKETGYYISDFKPPGAWTTDETVTFKDQYDKSGILTCGLGFSNDELHISGSTAMHDFVVGLICFDRVYLQLISLSALFNVLKEDLFREVIEADALRFIHTVHVPAVLYEPDSTFGTLAIILLGGTSEKPIAVQPGETIPEMPIREMLERQIAPAKGKEREASEFIDKIEKTVKLFKYPKGDSIGFELTDALLMPEVSRLLGISDAVLPTQVPLWLRFPYLRMADLVHTGSICSRLGIQAAKIPFGGTSLVSAAFGIQLATEWAERVASYGMSGRFDANLGEYAMQRPQIIRKILTFRNSAEGEKFRKEVGNALWQDTGAEFTASVNAGLRRNIPLDVLQKGHDKLVSLMTESAKITAVPVVWSDPLLSDSSTIFWRRKSLRMLLELCKLRGISKDDPCVCGSGEKLRVCCMRPLTS
jgi:hypothetical protein